MFRSNWLTWLCFLFVVDQVLESMSSLTRLTSLVIEKYELQSLTVVAQFSQLETLALRRVFVKETPTASIFHQLPHLKVLQPLKLASWAPVP